MNAYNEISGILSAMGAIPEITDNGVKVNAPTVNGFTFEQLSGAAKGNVRQWYINQSDYLKRFQEDCENELYDVRNVNAELIKRFYSDMFDFFQELDDAIRNGLYDYIYNPSDDDISDFCDANEIYFNEEGEPI